jgi:hypothetical protein
MAVYQTDRDRCLALLVSSYRLSPLGTPVHFFIAGKRARDDLYSCRVPV